MTIAITLDWWTAEAFGNIWQLAETEVTTSNASVLKEQGDIAFDNVATAPDDANITLVVSIDGQEHINYTAPKEEFLASEYNQVRLSRLADDMEQPGISQDIADMIKNYIQSLVK